MVFGLLSLRYNTFLSGSIKVHSTGPLLLLSRFSRVRLCAQPHRRQPTRLLCPWDSPGKNTGVGCHFLLQCMKAKSKSEVAQSCPTHSDPMDCSLPGSSIHGIFRQEYWSRVPLPSDGQLGCSSLFLLEIVLQCFIYNSNLSYMVMSIFSCLRAFLFLSIVNISSL